MYRESPPVRLMATKSRIEVTTAPFAKLKATDCHRSAKRIMTEAQPPDGFPTATHRRGGWMTCHSRHLSSFVTLTYARPIDDPFDAAEQQLEDLLEAAKKLRATLLRTETHYRQTLKGVRRRSQITATIKANRFDVARQDLTDTLKDFERQRHRTRGSVILAQLAEGESITEIGQSWGFSHQLASKYAREATGGAETGR